MRRVVSPLGEDPDPAFYYGHVELGYELNEAQSPSTWVLDVVVSSTSFLFGLYLLLIVSARRLNIWSKRSNEMPSRPSDRRSGCDVLSCDTGLHDSSCPVLQPRPRATQERDRPGFGRDQDDTSTTMPRWCGQQFPSAPVASINLLKWRLSA